MYQSTVIQLGITSGQIVGERRSPSVFWRGNAVPLAYTTTATYNISNRKKCALNALFKVTPIVNRGNFKSCIL